MLMQRVAGRFARIEMRQRARALVEGLVADLPRKNCWSLAEHAGHTSPDGLQHLLRKARWDADAVRDDVRDVAVEHLGDRHAMLVLDETGDLKKGSHTVGVQRQYTGTAGRIENAQVAVFATYATDRGHTLIDRELYLPRGWADDPDRRQAAGVPDNVAFATKPQLATRMITRAVHGGVPVNWVAADEAYGDNTTLRGELETQQLGYVLAISCDHRVRTGAGVARADTVVTSLPQQAWQRVSAGAGAHGQRFYDWALTELNEPGTLGRRWLLARRNRRTRELAYYRCHNPSPVPLSTLVRVAGRRWTVEESFQTAKGQTGLDQHQVRRWNSWYRWTTLVLLAHAFLAITTATARTRPAPAGLIPLTLPECARLFHAAINVPPNQLTHSLTWSTWRRRHQHRARQAHYQRQRDREP
jgi:SRSO17 transposase